MEMDGRKMIDEQTEKRLKTFMSLTIIGHVPYLFSPIISKANSFRF